MKVGRRSKLKFILPVQPLPDAKDYKFNLRRIIVMQGTEHGSFVVYC